MIRFLFAHSRSAFCVAALLLTLPLYAATKLQRDGDLQPVLDRPASMINELDDDAIFYLRLPNLFSGLAGDGRRTDRAYQSAAHQQIIARLQQRIMTYAQPLLHKQIGIAELALLHLNGPIEIVVQGAGGVASPASALIVRMPIRPLSRPTIAQLLSKGISESEPLKFGADGVALMTPAPDMGVRFELSNADRLLTIKLQAQTFQQEPSPYRGLPTKNIADISMRAKRLEPSDTGFVMVARLSAFHPIVQSLIATGDDNARQMYAAFSQVNTIAIGAGYHSANSFSKKAGSSKGTGGAFSVELDLNERAMKYLPAGQMRFDAPTLGTPDSMFSLQLPNQKQARAMVNAVDQLIGDRQYALSKALDDLPMNPLEIFDVIGPSVVAYNDEGGTALAIELHDPKAWEQFLAKLDKAMENSLVRLHRREFQTRGERYLALDLRSTMADSLKPLLDVKPTAAEQSIIDETLGTSDDQPTALDQELSTWLDLLAEQRSGLGVFRTSGKWLLWSEIPQPLFGRKAGNAPLGRWLAKTQQQDFSTSLIAGSMQARHHAKLGYHIYLSMLQNLSDLLGADIAIEDMPSARELKIPEIGAIGFSVDRMQSGVAFRLHYQNSPAELLGSNGVTTVAVVAVLAAVAIPAYQDYILRSRITAATVAVRSMQIELTEMQSKDGELPTQFESTAVPPANVDSIRFDDGVITLLFNDDTPRLAGKGLQFVACKSENPDELELTWRCGNQECAKGDRAPYVPELTDTIEEKLWPAICK